MVCMHIFNPFLLRVQFVLFFFFVLLEDVLYPAQDWLNAARDRLLGLYAVKMLKAELLSRSVNLNMQTAL